MNRLLLTLFLCASVAGTSLAQSSLTVSYSNMLIGAGGQLKYAYDFYGVQWGFYGAVISLPFIEDVDPFPYWRMGMCINSVPRKDRSVSLYAGGSIEYVQNKVRTKPFRTPYYVQYGYMIGPQLGLNVKLPNKHLKVNVEWGLRAGIYNYFDTNYSPGGAHYGSITRSVFGYPLGSVGLVYTFAPDKLSRE